MTFMLQIDNKMLYIFSIESMSIGPNDQPQIDVNEVRQWVLVMAFGKVRSNICSNENGLERCWIDQLERYRAEYV